MTIAVVDRPVTAGQYSAPSAITPVSLRPLDQANQRLENKYGDEVERISRSMRSAEPMVRMESPRSVDQKSNRLRMPATRAQRSDQCNGSGLPYGAGALDAHRAGPTGGPCLPRPAEFTAKTLWKTVYSPEVIDRVLSNSKFERMAVRLASDRESHNNVNTADGRPNAHLVR